MNDVGFKNATFNEIDHSVVYEHDLRGTAATEEGVERCVNETSLITGAVIFLIAQVHTCDLRGVNVLAIDTPHIGNWTDFCPMR